MHVYNKPRQSGKTTEIVDQACWCAIFNIVPVCIITCNSKMADHIQTLVQSQKLSEADEKNIYIFAAPYSSNAYFRETRSMCWDMKKILTMDPKRIYIDEYTYIDHAIISVLNHRFNDRVYAYGTRLGD